MLQTLLTRGLAGLIIAVLVSGPAEAQLAGAPPAEDVSAGRRVANAVRVASPPVVDGRLSDAAWQEATPLTGFVQHEPREGEPVTERTEVRIVFDDDALYIGAWLFDTNPGGIVDGEHRRDASLRDADAFRIVLDTYRDRQNGFVFGTTPAGIEYDGQVTEEGTSGSASGERQQVSSGGGLNLNWDGNWEVVTTRDAEGWYAEFRIPFSTLRYRGGEEQVWGLNFARHIGRKNEQAFWSPIPRQFDFYRLTLAGTVEGLEVPFRRPITLTPYALASAQKDFVVGGAATYPTDFGGDLKVGITGSLAADLTWNTDFAHVEVDEQIINLTRFNVRFPEKRPFFMENAGLFSVGRPSVEMFFSRRIGIARNGTPVPIAGGGRLSGRALGMNIGALHIHTDGLADLDQPANAFTVARVARDLPNRSQVGAIVVNRAGKDRDGDYNRTVAVDGRWGVSDGLTFDAFLANTETPGREGRDHAFNVGGDYANRDWRATVAYAQVGEDFNPEVGFLSRSGYRMVELGGRRTVRPERYPRIREWAPHVTYRTYHDFDGFQETGYLHLDPILFVFPNGGRFNTWVNLTREGLKRNFAITRDVIVPAGTYDNAELTVVAATNPSARISADGRVTMGGFLSGSQMEGSGAVRVREGASAADLRLTRTRVDLPEGLVDVTLLGLRLAYSFRPSVFVQSLVQYSDRNDTWSGNVRFGWLNRAGTGLFLVYNEQQRAGELSGPMDRGFIVKYTRQFDLSGF